MAIFHPLLAVPLLAVLSELGLAYDSPSPNAPPRFSLVSATAVQEGQQHFSELRTSASAETFLDKMFGTHCYTQAVAELQRDCKSLDQEQNSRLALRLVNCQLATQGQTTYPCSPAEHLRTCVERLSNRAHALFVEFLTHAASMCLFIQNQEFDRRTETLLNHLNEGATFALGQLEKMGARARDIHSDTAAIKATAEESLARVKEQRELQLAAVLEARAHRTESAAQFSEISQQQAAALDAAKRQLSLVEELGDAAAKVGKKLDAGEAAVNAAFRGIEAKAMEAQAAQAAAAEAQQLLGEQLSGLADGSRRLRSAIDVVTEYQRRSDATLIKLLGRSYSLEDAAFYAAGLASALLAGTTKATQGARLPMLGLLGASLLAERMLVDRLHPFLEVDEAGDLALPLQLPSWLPSSTTTGGPLLLNFKWAVRRAAVLLAAMAVLAALFSYRDYEKANYRRLEEMNRALQRGDEWQKGVDRRLSAFHAELARTRIEALGRAAASDSGGGNKGGIFEVGERLAPATVARLEEPQPPLRGGEAFHPPRPEPAADAGAAGAGRETAAEHRHKRAVAVQRVRREEPLLPLAAVTLPLPPPPSLEGAAAERERAPSSGAEQMQVDERGRGRKRGVEAAEEGDKGEERALKVEAGAAARRMRLPSRAPEGAPVRTSLRRKRAEGGVEQQQQGSSAGKSKRRKVK